jgi:predicted dehydrogenase
MSTPLRTVVVGLEHFHVTGWLETLGLFPEQIEIMGRYDPDPARVDAARPTYVDPNLPQRFPDSFLATPFFSDIDRLIQDVRPHLAVVTLPNRLAPDAIVELARAGCHVLVDKPGALDAAGAKRSVEAARASGVNLAVAFTRRYGRPWQQVAREIRRGRLGRLLTSEAIFVTSSVPVRDPRNRIFNRAEMGGGILHWLGIHDIDLIQWLSGEPVVSVQAMSATMSSAEIEVEDTISVAYRLAGGSIGTMHFAYALPRAGGEGYAALRGSNGSVVISPAGTIEWIGPGSVAEPLRSETIATDTVRLPGYGSAGASIVFDLLDAISNGRDPLATGENARDALRVVDAAYLSARTGERVEIAAMSGACHK